MTVQTAEHDPIDLAGQRARAEESRQWETAAAIQRRKDLVWMLSGERGRRAVRLQLREAGFDTAHDGVRTVLDRHHGQMCFNEGLRTRGMQTLWPLMRLLASGEIPFDSFQKLMTEAKND